MKSKESIVKTALMFANKYCSPNVKYSHSSHHHMRIFFTFTTFYRVAVPTFWFFHWVEITSGGEGKCVAEFTVSEEHLNRGGGLHGGFTATLVDNVTTYALMSNDCHPGVSVDLHVSYLKGAKEGDQVIVDANTVKAGKTLAYIECELRHKKDGSIIAKGTQTKFIGF